MDKVDAAGVDEPAKTPLRDRICIVTGGTAGIGLAIASALHREGARVVTCSRGAMLHGTPEGWLHVTGDVADPSLSERLVQLCVDTWGRLDVAIASAGVGYFGGLCDPTDDQVAEMVSTNLLGTIWLVRAATTQFRAQANPGDLVLVSSAAGYRGEAFEAVYASTKHAQVGLAGALDREVAAEGIRTLLIAPAGVETEFALGYGRVVGDPRMADFMRPQDVADAILMALGQDRNVRTTSWQFRSIRQEG